MSTDNMESHSDVSAVISNNPTQSDSVQRDSTQRGSSHSGETASANERVPLHLLLSIIATGIMAFVGILTETLTNVLFPELMQEFNIGTSTVQWLTTGYLLVVALVTPLSSYLKRKVPLKWLFLAAITLCIAGCLLAACTLNFPMLMTARILQGAGTGVAMPLMFNIILEQSPKSKIGMLMGVGSMVCATAPALGPTVGGLVGTFMPWRWIFVILLPFLILALFLGLASIRQVTPNVNAQLNPVQVICLCIGFVSLIFALDQGGAAITAMSTGDTHALTTLLFAIALLVVAVVALIAFGMLSRRSFSPLVRLGVFRDVAFRWHVLAYVLFQFVMIGFGYMIPNSTQLGYGMAPLTAGLVVLPGALLGAALGPVAGSLLDRFGPVKPISAAMAVALLGTILMATVVGPSSNALIIGSCYFVFMLGFSMSFGNTMTSGLSHIPPQLKPDGNAVFNTLQQLSGAAGTTAMSVFLGVAQANHGTAGSAEFATATQNGAHWGYVALAVVVACACLSNIRAFVASRNPRQ